LRNLGEARVQFDLSMMYSHPILPAPRRATYFNKCFPYHTCISISLRFI
jgi:hypothetical protein